MDRIDKIIASQGMYSRKEVKSLISKKRVTIDGIPVSSSSQKADPMASEIVVNGQVLEFKKNVYLILNKPEGYVSATEDREHPTVLELVPDEFRGRDIFPAGRLDKDTTGLLLITNDGPLAHQLLSPKHHVEKEYALTLKHAVTQQDIALIAKGVTEGEDTFLPAVYTPTGENTGTIILHEGKFHEIKRIFLALDNEVVQLKRIRMKNLVLDESLEPGEYRPLTEEELTELKQLL